MRRFALVTVFAVLAAMGCKEGAGAQPEGAPAEEKGDWTDHVKASGTARAGADGEARLVLEGKEGWWVNRAYPGIKVTLKAPPALEPGKRELGRDDVAYEELKGDDKAKRAVFTVPLKGEAPSEPLQVEYKMVVCSPDTCSEPFTGAFEVPVTAAGE